MTSDEALLPTREGRARQAAYDLLLDAAYRVEQLGDLPDVEAFDVLVHLAEACLVLGGGPERGCDGCDRVVDAEVFTQGMRFQWADQLDQNGDVTVSVCPACVWAAQDAAAEDERRDAESYDWTADSVDPATVAEVDAIVTASRTTTSEEGQRWV